jgi:glycosyltransferase involved in cell wall biosynthesis
MVSGMSKHMKNKIALVTFARFPSEMAYGTHLIQIAKGFLQNDFVVTIYYPKTYNAKTIYDSPNDYYNLNNEINFVEVENNDITSTKFYNLLPNYIQRVLYSINTFVWVKNLKKTHQKEEYVWSTNPNILWSLKNEFKYLIYEKHGEGRYVQRIFTSKLKKIKNAYLIGVTEMSFEKIKDALNHPLLLPNGVDTTQFKPKIKSDDQLSVGYVGFLETYGVDKGVLNSTKELIKIGKEINFSTTIIGGPEKKINEIKSLVSENNSEDSFNIFNFIPHNDVPNIISDFDIGIVHYPDNKHMNLYASPMKIFELAACGVPILASNIEGHLQLKKYDLGIIYFQHDNFEDFRLKMIELLKDKSMRVKLSKKSLQNIQQFSLENRIKIILESVRSSIG